ncbi:MAG: hypothetical protein SGBAC_008862 [Bacillariaceae sp.]
MSPRNNKRKQFETKPNIPVLANPSREEFQDAFDTYKAVHLPLFLQQQNTPPPPPPRTIEDPASNDLPCCCDSDPNLKSAPFSWKDLKQVFADLQEEDKKSWCIENGKVHHDAEGNADNNSTKDAYGGALDFLDPKDEAEEKAKEKDFAYCSFLIQNDNRAKQEALSRFPLSTLPIFAEKWAYGPSIWVFFGRNQFGTEEMQGRPEHTDSVSHDGTWHYQLSGIKKWHLRPTIKLLEHLKATRGVDDLSKSDVIQVNCNAGDVLVVNTALWWHQTKIPPQPDPSVSYARDFYLDASKMDAADMIEEDGGGMTNVDGMYASDDVDAGTVVFTEHDMPDGELHRSATAPNCEVVELEDGTNAVVTTKDVACGDFFCLPEANRENEDDEDDDAEEAIEEEED